MDSELSVTLKLKKLCAFWVNHQLNVELALSVALVNIGVLGTEFGAAKTVRGSIVMERLSYYFKHLQECKFEEIS